MIESIDIGGPSLVRDQQRILNLLQYTKSSEYDGLIKELEKNRGQTLTQKVDGL